MKSKGILGLMLLGVLAWALNSSAFAVDSTADELKKVTEERDALKNALDEKNSEKSFWYSIGLKKWMPTLQPGDGTSRTVSGGPSPSVTLTGGYGSMFLNLSTGGGGDYQKPNSTEIMTHYGETYSLGYIINSDWIVALGLKDTPGSILNIPAPYTSSVYFDNIWFTTIGTGYSHSFTDTPYSFNAAFTYGQGTASAGNGAYGFTGTTSGPSTFISYDLGGSYSLSKSFKVSLFYRVEQWDALMPTTLYAQPDPQGRNGVLAMSKMTLGGPGAGITYSF